MTNALGERILETDEGFKYINKRYATALLATATLLLISQVIIQLTITNMKADARVVNISGRQRMLSQKISKCAFGVYLAQNDTERGRYLEELGKAKALWQASHAGLRHGDRRMELPGHNSPEANALLDKLEPHYRAMIGAVDAILGLGDYDGKRGELLELVRNIQKNEGEFLLYMDKTVFQYDLESNSKLFHLQILEFTILVVALVVLILEWRVVFKPAQKEIKEGFDVLRKNEEYLTQLFETAPTLTVLFDSATLKVVKYNAMAVQLIRDWLAIELGENTSFRDIFPGMGDKDMSDRLLAKIREEGEFSNLEVGITERKIVLMSAKTVDSGGKRLYLVGLSDITTLKHVATFDSMTAMLNRRAGLELLSYLFDEAVKNGTPLVICFIDIDRLKFVNDLYGHQEGDWYIKTVAQTINEATGDRYKGIRYGGDELVVITESAGRDEFEAKIAEIGQRLSRIGHENFRPYTMSISHGFASLPSEYVKNVNEFIEEADIMMYENKKAKRAAREG